MLRPGIASGIVCLVLAAGAADEPNKPGQDPVPVTRDKLRGKWEGPKGVPITLEFAEKKVTVTVITTDGGKQKPTALVWDYEINPKDHWITLCPLDQGGGLGSAKLNADGTLSVGIVLQPPTIPKTFENVTFTRVKPKDPKK
jgi:hypothetical protein